MSYDDEATGFGGEEEFDDNIDLPLDETMTDDFESEDDSFDKDH